MHLRKDTNLSKEQIFDDFPNLNKVLICPLDWGLGHAARDVFLINRLLGQGCEVVIGGSGASLTFLQNEFSKLRVIDLDSFQIRFSRRLPAWLMIVFQLPGFFISIHREHRQIIKICKKDSFDLIVSDCRFGLWHSAIPSIIITHQIAYMLPGILSPFEYFTFLFNRFLINRFSVCWIPDFPAKINLSGKLSHRFRLPCNASYIGPLSRYNSFKITLNPRLKYDFTAIISGPEPQRTVFEEIIVNQLLGSHKTSIIISGKPFESVRKNLSSECELVSFLSGRELAEVILCSKYIICRPGYSVIMDLFALKKTALLVPTPGQTEQEYLAVHLQEAGLFTYSKQKDLSLEIPG